MQAFVDGAKRFHTGLMRGSKAVLAWVIVLGGTLMIGPFFFWAHIEARVVFGVFMVSAVLMMWMTGKYGYTRILGLGHILFIPLIAYIAMRLDKIPEGEPIGMFLCVAMILILISLVFDTFDVLRYARGERLDMDRPT